MDSFADYLVKSTIWLTGFGLIYFLFLRNERFFVLNRIFLIIGILASLIFPLFSFRYTVLLPFVQPSTYIPIASTQIPVAEISPLPVLPVETQSEPFHFQDYWMLLYGIGVFLLLARLLKQLISVFRVIRKTDVVAINNLWLIRTSHYPAPFSFFSYVFVNPSVSSMEMKEIVNHEQEHVRQKHWVDLLLFELLCVVQWFNPMIWWYGRFIRQNHEYLADEQAVRHSSNPALYRAALLNQMFGGAVIQLGNSFNYSLNKKRFNMMKKTIHSPLRKLKLFLIIPFVSGVFYAFAEPEYRMDENNSQQEEASSLYENNEDNSSVTENTIFDSGKEKDLSIPVVSELKKVDKKPQKEELVTKTVSGKVVDENGKNLEGASVVVKNTTTGTTTDENGVFNLELMDDTPLVISYVGFRTQEVTPIFDNAMHVRMISEIIGIEKVVVVSYATIRTSSKSIEKKSTGQDKVFTIVEQMPEFPGGPLALRKYIAQKIKYPYSAQKDGIQGQVFVNFVINSEGQVCNVKVVRSVCPALDNEAIRVIYSLPQWSPGVQQEKAVDVSYTIPIDFILEIKKAEELKPMKTGTSPSNE